MNNNQEQSLNLFEQTVASVQPTQEWLKQADEFMKMVSAKPSTKAIKKNPFANNAEYVEVGYMEMKLDQITRGLWNSEVIDTKIMGNSICCTVRVRFFHWHFKTWLHRDGVGACPIEVKKGASPVDFSQISAKAIQKNLPVARTEAFKNACKSIGNLFGRHPNREFQHEYQPEPKMEQFINS